MNKPKRQISTLLVANRGEIAVRIMGTAKKLGISTVAVYSEADANALHVKTADVSVCIGEANPSDSYLNVGAIIAAAKSSHADAIHPGYGFLSENPELVDACDAAGIIFVGPSAKAMRLMGLKDAAKALMEKAGVPVVPGFHGENQDASFLTDQAQQIGYPVLIKARAGGGGKGMRRVDHAEQFGASLKAAQREAESSFGDSAVLIEKYIEHPRHIEVQVFGDDHGHCVHLFERDCSLQRRHQKVIEEAPAPGMTQELRDAMTQAAVRAAKSIQYAGAGTVEFIVDASGPLRADGFWFMEMNTRLQVEHPVTEAVTGFDLVEWQLLVAQGHALPVEQTDIKLNGHAVEARLYAEDVNAGFLPATGTLHRYQLDKDNVGLVYSGVDEGDVVQPFYDPMLAKLVSHAPDRAGAFRLLHGMLDKSSVMGATTNRAFLAQLCLHKDVLAGNVHTGLIEQGYSVGSNNADETVQIELSPALALAAVMSANMPSSHDESPDSPASVYSELGLWQLWSTPERLVELQANQQSVMLRVQRTAENGWQVNLDSSANSEMVKPATCLVRINNWSLIGQGVSIEFDGLTLSGVAFATQEAIYCRVGPEDAEYSRPSVQQLAGSAANGAAILSPMPGRIIALSCNSGSQVLKGDVLVTLEAMKMEHSLTANRDATIATVAVAVGDQVEQGMPLILFADND